MTTINHNDPDETIQPLAEDNDPPFSPPDDVPSSATESDDDLDVDEAYHEGNAIASESTPQPNYESAVENYDPDSDSRS